MRKRSGPLTDRHKPQDDTNRRHGRRRTQQEKTGGQQQDGGAQSGRQIDDNQDDLGRDVNDPGRIGNQINRTGHSGA